MLCLALLPILARTNESCNGFLSTGDDDDSESCCSRSCSSGSAWCEGDEKECGDMLDGGWVIDNPFQEHKIVGRSSPVFAPFSPNQIVVYVGTDKGIAAFDGGFEDNSWTPAADTRKGGTLIATLDLGDACDATVAMDGGVYQPPTFVIAGCDNGVHKVAINYLASGSFSFTKSWNHTGSVTDYNEAVKVEKSSQVALSEDGGTAFVLVRSQPFKLKSSDQTSHAAVLRALNVADGSVMWNNLFVPEDEDADFCGAPLYVPARTTAAGSNPSMDDSQLKCDNKPEFNVAANGLVEDANCDAVGEHKNLSLLQFDCRQYLVCVNAQDGKEIWKHETDSKVTSPTCASPVLSNDGEVIWYCTDNGCAAYHVTKKSPQFKWSTTRDEGLRRKPPFDAPSFRYAVTTVAQHGEGSGSIIFFGAGDWRLYAFSGANGMALGVAPKAYNPIRSTPTVNHRDQIVYYGADDGKLRAVRFKGDIHCPQLCQRKVSNSCCCGLKGEVGCNANSDLLTLWRNKNSDTKGIFANRPSYNGKSTGKVTSAPAISPDGHLVYFPVENQLVGEEHSGAFVCPYSADLKAFNYSVLPFHVGIESTLGSRSFPAKPPSEFRMDLSLSGNVTTAACTHQRNEETGLVRDQLYPHNGFTTRDGAYARVVLGKSFIGNKLRMVDPSLEPALATAVQTILLTPELYYGGPSKRVSMKIALYGLTKDFCKPTSSRKVTVAVATPADMQGAVASQVIDLEDTVTIVTFNLPSAWFQGGGAGAATSAAVTATLEGGAPSDKFDVGAVTLYPHSPPTPDDPDAQRLEAELPYNGVYKSSTIDIDVYARTNKPLRIIAVTAVIGGDAKGVRFAPDCIDAVDPRSVPGEMKWKYTAIRSSGFDKCTYSQSRAVVVGNDPRVNGKELVMRLRLQVPGNAKPGSYSVEVFVSEDLDSARNKAITKVGYTGVGVPAIIDGRLEDDDGQQPVLPAIHVIADTVMGMFSRMANEDRMVNTAVLDGVEIKPSLEVVSVTRRGAQLSGQSGAFGSKFPNLKCTTEGDTTRIVKVASDCSTVLIQKTHTLGGKGNIKVSLRKDGGVGDYIREVGMRVWFPDATTMAATSGADLFKIPFSRWDSGPAHYYTSFKYGAIVTFKADGDLHFTEDITRLVDWSVTPSNVAKFVDDGAIKHLDLPNGASMSMLTGSRQGDAELGLKWALGNSKFTGEFSAGQFSVFDDDLKPVQLHAFAVRKADVEVTVTDEETICVTVPPEPPTLTFEGDKVTIYAVVEMNNGELVEVNKMYGLKVSSLVPEAVEVQENGNEFEVVVPAKASDAALGSLISVWWNPQNAPNAILRSCAKLAVTLPSADSVTVRVANSKLTRSSQHNSAQKAGIPVETDLVVTLHWDAKDGVPPRSQIMSGDSRTHVNLDAAGDRLQVKTSERANGKLVLKSTADAEIGTAKVMVYFDHTPLNKTVEISLVEFERFIITAEPDPPTCNGAQDKVDAATLSLIKGTKPESTSIFQRAKAACRMGLSDNSVIDLKSEVTFEAANVSVLNLGKVKYDKTDFGHRSGNVVASPLGFGSTTVSCVFGWNVTDEDDVLLVNVDGEVEAEKITKHEIIQGSTVLGSNSAALRGVSNVDTARSCLQVKMTDGHCYGRGRTYCSPFEAGGSELPGLLSFASSNTAEVEVNSATGVLTLVDNGLSPITVTATAAGTAPPDTVEFSQQIAANLDPVGDGDVDLGKPDGHAISSTLAAGDTFDLEVRINTAGKTLGDIDLYITYGDDIEPLLDGEAKIKENVGAVVNVAGCDMLSASMNSGALQILGACKPENKIKNNAAPSKQGERWRSPGVHLITVKLKALRTGVPSIAGYIKKCTDVKERIGPVIGSDGRAFIAGDFSRGKGRRSVTPTRSRIHQRQQRQASTATKFIPGDADLGRYGLVDNKNGRGRVSLNDYKFTRDMWTQNSGCVALANSGRTVSSQTFDMAGCCYYDSDQVTIACDKTNVKDFSDAAPSVRLKTNAVVHTEFEDYKSFFDLNYDTQQTLLDSQWLFYVLTGQNALVQQPPSLPGFRGTPLHFVSPTNATGCKMEIQTSIFIPSDPITDLFRAANDASDPNFLDTMLKVYVVLADDSDAFAEAATEAVSGSGAAAIHVIDGSNPAEGGKGAILAMEKSSVTDVVDANGVPSGVYVNYITKVYSTLNSGVMADTQGSIAVALRKKLSDTIPNPTAYVEYLPPRVNRKRPLVTSSHLSGWNQRVLGDGTGFASYCEDELGCIFNANSEVAGFAVPAGINGSDTCWTTCHPTKEVVDYIVNLWWILALIIVFLFILAAAVYCTWRPPLEVIIAEVSPEYGLPGDEVKIFGEYLCRGNPKKNYPLIRLAGIPVDKIVGTPTDYEITVIAGHTLLEGTAGTVKLVHPYKMKKSVEDPKFTESPEDVTFTYQHEIDRTTITKVTPAEGIPGDEILIEGIRLHVCDSEYYKEFTLAGIPVKHIVGKPKKTKVIVIAGEAAPGTSGRVALESWTAARGGKLLSDDDTIFTYRPVFAKPLITSVQPNEGVGGDVITIEGKFLCGGYTRAVNGMLLAGIPVGKIVGDPTDTKIVVLAGEAPPSTSGAITLKSKWDDVFEVPEEDATFTYCKAFHNTEIASISPATGEGGTEVTIFGSNLLGHEPEGITSITLAGVPVMRIVGTPRDDQVIVIVDHANGGTSGSVVLHGGSGASFSSAQNNVVFTYNEETEEDFDFSGPVIDDVNPRFGKPGYLAVGEDGSHSKIKVIAGEALPGTHGIIKFESSSGGSDMSVVVQTTSIQFSYLAAFKETTITRIHPTQGFEGTEVTIYGSKLHGGDANGVSNVLLAGFNALRIVGRPTDSEIKVVAGAAPPETQGVVTLQTAAGASFPSGPALTFQYWPEFYGLTIASVTPTEGDPGSEVTITGKNLDRTPLKRVILAGGVEARIVGTPSATSITVVAGDAAHGTSGPISFESESGTAHEMPNNVWNYRWRDFHAFTLKSITPAIGDPGTEVVLSGENLNTTPLKAVFLAGGVEARIVGTPSATSITVVAGKAAHGTSGPISFVSESGTEHGMSNVWKYRWRDFHEFAVTDITPTDGNPGDSVNITGENLNRTSLKAVFLAGGVEARIVGTPSATSITVVAGKAAHGTSGPISFVSESGTEHGMSNVWKYQWPDFHEFAVTSVTPAKGDPGTEVTIEGANLNSTILKAVFLSGVEGRIVSTTATSITVVAGKAAHGTSGPISFESESGTEHIAAGLTWKYMKMPKVISFDPPEGLAEEFIDIVGEELLMGGDSIASVTVAGIPATVVAGSAKDDSMTICTGPCKINVRTKMGPQGPIVITGVDGRTITSGGIYKYNANDVKEGQRMGLDNDLHPERRGTFSLEKALRRTTATVEDAVDLSTGVIIAKDTSSNNLGDRIEYGSYNQKVEKKPTVLLRSKRVSYKGPSLILVQSEYEAAEAAALAWNSKKEKAKRSTKKKSKRSTVEEVVALAIEESNL
eukprot:gene1575-2693_t